MKNAALALGLLMLGGCGSILNLGIHPEIYGGVRYDLEVHGSSCMPIGPLYCDIPFSFVLDTALLPVTAIVEGIRWATPAPSEGVAP
jgi:uncharacterized protein YceK